MGHGKRFIGGSRLGIGRTTDPSGARRRLGWLLTLMLVFQTVALVGSAPGLAAAVDTTPPQLVEFSFTPTTLDASTGDQTITVTARISDDMAGVGDPFGEPSSAWFGSPSADQRLIAEFSDSNRISGDEYDGVYQVTMTVPRYAEHGTWTVRSVFLVDLIGNTDVVLAAALTGRGFPTSFTQTGAGDSGPPQLTAFTIAPTTVDTSGGEVSMTFTAQLTDNLSGVGGDPTSVRFTNAATGQSVDVLFTASDRISGTVNDGVYQTTVALPRYSATGLWTVDWFEASDMAGNWMTLSTSQMTSAGFPTAFTQTGAGDVTRPVLKDFSFEPTTVDTTLGYDTVVFTMRISDDIAGVGSPERPGWVTVTGPTLTHGVGVAFSAMDRVAGDAFNGTYEVAMPIMQFTETGVWTVESVAFADNLGNQAYYLTADLVSAGFPTQFTSLEPEANPPTLVDFSLTPSKVDTSTGPRTITMKARIIDDAAGLGGEPGQTGITLATQVSFMSPSTNESVDAGFSYQDRVSGDALDGVYEVQLTVPKGSEQGTWTVTDFILVDAYGNMRTLDAGDLATSGFASFFAVTEPGGAPPPIGPTPTVGLVDPGTGLWYLRDSGGVVSSFYFGNPGDFPIVGDWDCDGVDTPGMYRQSDGYVYLRNSNTQGIADIRFFFGNPGDVPLAGDFNGDGCDTVSIYRPSLGRFYIINKLGANEGGLGAAETDYLFGNPGDKPFVGDFDGDGVDTVGLHRESTGLVYFRQTHTQGIADSQFIYGNPGDRIVAGDWNADGTDTPALFRPLNTTMYFRYTNTQGNADNQFTFGQSTWLPVAGRFGLG